MGIAAYINFQSSNVFTYLKVRVHVFSWSLFYSVYVLALNLYDGNLVRISIRLLFFVNTNVSVP